MYENVYPSKFPGPTTPFKPGHFSGAAMACGFSAPVCHNQAVFAVQAFHAMGWTAPPAFDGAFSPQVQSGFIDRAIQQHLKGIVLVSIDVKTIKAAVDRALAAGLIITCTMCTSGPAYAGKVYDVTVNWQTQGAMQAWGILARNGTNAKVVAFDDKEFSPPPLRIQGMQATFSSACPSCKFEIRDFTAADVTKPGPPEWTAALATHPTGTLTDGVAVYDGMGVLMAKTAKQQGRTDLKVDGFDGTPPAQADIVNQSVPYGQTVAEAYTYAEWAAVDLIGRKTSQQPLWTGYDNLPSVLIDKTNASKYLTSDPVPAGNWQQTSFEKYWQK